MSIDNIGKTRLVFLSSSISLEDNEPVMRKHTPIKETSSVPVSKRDMLTFRHTKEKAAVRSGPKLDTRDT